MIAEILNIKCFLPTELRQVIKAAHIESLTTSNRLYMTSVRHRLKVYAFVCI